MKKHIIKLLIFIITPLFFLNSCTEEMFIEPTKFGKIVGNVVNYDTKKSENNVLVRLNPSGKSIETDSTGKFTFDSLTVGKYTIQATKNNLFTEFVTVEVTADLSPNPTIYMSKNIISNKAPQKPSIISPSNGFNFDQDKILLTWSSSDDDKDTLTYDIYLFKEGESPEKPYLSDYSNDTLIITNLLYNAKYYWQIVAKDKITSTYGEIWNFKTAALPELTYVFTKEINGTFQIAASNGTIESEKILTSTGNSWRPIVSPDRKEIAYVSNKENGEKHLYIMNMDGSNNRKITTIPINIAFPSEFQFSWAANGSQLVFPNFNGIYAINKDGSGLLKLADASAGRLFVGCDYNQGKRQIIARSVGKSIYDNEIILIKTTSSSEVIIKTENRMSTPTFSIDGEKIVYSRDISNFKNEAGRQLDARIFILDLNTKAEVDLSNRNTSNSINKPIGTNDLEPSFSPNNAYIIFTNTQNDGVSTKRLFYIDLNNSVRTLISENALMGNWRKQ